MTFPETIGAPESSQATFGANACAREGNYFLCHNYYACWFDDEESKTV
jgi:hypothetical protein